MEVHISDTPLSLGRAAGQAAATTIRQALEEQGRVHIILATGTSQFDMLNHLVKAEGIDWSRVTMFHLDEYIGLPAAHPASFRRYLQERFVEKVSGLGAAHFIAGDAPDPVAECRRLSALIREYAIDVAMIGIGENGHLAFNDPPADFDTEEPFIIVDLDTACRNQQLGEGWFPDLDSVPRKAITMSIRHILKSRRLIVSVPDERKARAVRDALREPLTPLCPASILREHPDCTLFLDQASASLL